MAAVVVGVVEAAEISSLLTSVAPVVAAEVDTWDVEVVVGVVV